VQILSHPVDKGSINGFGVILAAQLLVVGPNFLPDFIFLLDFPQIGDLPRVEDAINVLQESFLQNLGVSEQEDHLLGVATSVPKHCLQILLESVVIV
jgi:hypothetical protein